MIALLTWRPAPQPSSLRTLTRPFIPISVPSRSTAIIPLDPRSSQSRVPRLTNSLQLLFATKRHHRLYVQGSPRRHIGGE
jgi:hypothetical protein